MWNTDVEKPMIKAVGFRRLCKRLQEDHTWFSQCNLDHGIDSGMPTTHQKNMRYHGSIVGIYVICVYVYMYVYMYVM